MSETVVAKTGIGRQLIYVLPALVFIAIAAAFAIGLTLNPGEIPSALISKPVPEFTLPNGLASDRPVASQPAESER